MNDKRYMKALREGKPIECAGLTFYPIKMSDWDAFIETRPAVTQMMQSLPAAYISLPYLAALWAIDIDAIENNMPVTGLFGTLMRFMTLALRTADEETPFQIFVEKDTQRLAYVRFFQNGRTADITPLIFSTEIRPLLCEQNGLELPDEAANLELLEAEKEIAELNDEGIDFNPETLVSSVAYMSHVTEEEIYENWTVRSFMRRKEAIDRELCYRLYRTAALAGTIKTDGNNPFPSWCFDRRTKGTTSALVSPDGIVSGFGS